MGFEFEWTFRAGDILTFVGAIGVAAAFLYRRGGKDISIDITLKTLTDQFAEMKTEFKSFSANLSKIAIQEMQIGLLMKWYDELKRGDGYVTGRKGVDGEYP